MKYLAVLVAIIALQICESADLSPLRCQGFCSNTVDFSNLESAINRGSCRNKIDLAGFKSGANTVRSLVCECDNNDRYVAKTNRCVQLYNCDIIIPLLKTGAPQIVNDIYNGVKKNTCEAIRIVTDNFANVYQDCIGGALAFQGDRTNGDQVAYFVDTCYNSTIVDLTESINRFDKTVPGAGEIMLNSIVSRYTPARNIYYGTEFRQCMAGLAGNTISTCGGAHSPGLLDGLLGLLLG